MPCYQPLYPLSRLYLSNTRTYYYINHIIFFEFKYYIELKENLLPLLARTVFLLYGLVYTYATSTPLWFFPFVYEAASGLEQWARWQQQQP